MGEMPLFAWGILLFAFAVSFLMSGMEAGVFALSPMRIRQLRRRGDRRAEALHNYLERPEAFLWTILVGNTIANFVIFVLLVVLIHQWTDGNNLLLVVCYLVTVFIFYAICELLPKILFRQFPNRLCLVLARPFQIIDTACSPIVWLVNWFSRMLLRWTGGRVFAGNLFGNREEVRFMMEESSAALSKEERTLINRVLELQNATVRSITIPWEQVTSVQMDTPMTEVLRIFRETKLQRLPVWKAGERRIAGVLNMKTVIYLPELPETRVAADFLKPALFLDEHLRLDDAIRRMQKSGRRMAIVLGPDRREIGIVSLHDMLKVIFGEVAF